MPSQVKKYLLNLSLTSGYYLTVITRKCTLLWPLSNHVGRPSLKVCLVFSIKIALSLRRTLQSLLQKRECQGRGGYSLQGSFWEWSWRKAYAEGLKAEDIYIYVYIYVLDKQINQ